MNNYYEILGVPQSATDLQIKKAYRKLALDLHPDKNSSPDPHGQFIRLTEAFEVLKNPRTRKLYDDIMHRSSFSDKQEKWKSDVEQTASRARAKGEQYANDFDYFSKEVIKRTTFVLLLEIVLSLLFADISTGILAPLVFLIGGPLIAYYNLDTLGTTGAIIFAAIFASIGFFWTRYQVRRMNDELG